MSNFPKFQITPRVKRIAYRIRHQRCIQLKDMVIHLFSEYSPLEKRYYNTIKIVAPDEQGEFEFSTIPTRYPATKLHQLNKILPKVTCFYAYIKRIIENSVTETNK